MLLPSAILAQQDPFSFDLRNLQHRQPQGDQKNPKLHSLRHPQTQLFNNCLFLSPLSLPMHCFQPPLRCSHAFTLIHVPDTEELLGAHPCCRCHHLLLPSPLRAPLFANPPLPSHSHPNPVPTRHSEPWPRAAAVVASRHSHCWQPQGGTACSALHNCTQKSHPACFLQQQLNPWLRCVGLN